MTISSTTVKDSYSGNSSTTNFAYTFKIFADSDLIVIIRSSAGTETTKSLTTHYTVAGAGVASGGSITFTSGNTPATGETVVIIRNVPQTQAIDYIANDPFPAETHEEGLDRGTMTIQQMQETLDRSFKVSRTNTITTPEFTDDASTRASKTLGFDSSGNLTTVADFLPAGGDSAQFTYSTTTTDSDPGSGIIRFDSTTLASVTAAYIDDLETNGTDVSAWLQSFDDVTGNATNRGRIRVSKANTLDVWHVWKISGAVTDASGYTKLALTYIDGAGALADEDKVFLSFTASGEDGAIPGYYYKFDTGTSDADPGAGEISFNNGTYASATVIYIDDVDQNAVTTQADTETWGDSTETIKGYLHIVDINDPTTYARFKITAAVTDASGYNKITVVHLASNNTFSAADELSIHFTRNGDAGASPGYFYKFDTGTSDADPGAGEIAFNNGTYASATAIYIDDVDQNSVNTVTDVLTWDDSSSTIKGYLHIVDINDHTTYARFSITGSSTDASGYNKLAVTHIASNNTFSAADSLSVHFTRQGDKGTTGDTGSTGSTAGTSGLGMTWETTTTDADQGAGKISGNNGTISSISILYVDDVDDAGAAIATFVQSWDDVSNAVARGYVQITKEGATGTYALFKVSGAVTDATGYTKVPVTHVVSNGSFSDGDGVGVQFVQSGADSAVTLSGTTNNTIATVTGANALIGESNLTFDGTNLLVASTGKLYLNDAGGEHISGSGSVLSIAGGAEIDLTATAIDINGTCDVSGVATFTGANVTQQALSSSSNAVAWNSATQPNAYHVTTENTTISAPSNGVEGAFICLEINFSAGHTIGWNTVFEFAASTEPTETAADTKTDLHVFRYNGAIWQEVGRTLNLSES